MDELVEKISGGNLGIATGNIFSVISLEITRGCSVGVLKDFLELNLNEFHLTYPEKSLEEFLGKLVDKFLANTVEGSLKEFLKVLRDIPGKIST